MLYLIAYDISDNRRLRRVARTCEDFGIRIEKSVFECRLEECDFEEMWERLSKIMHDGDRIVAYPIGAIEESEIKVLGIKRTFRHIETYVF